MSPVIMRSAEETEFPGILASLAQCRILAKMVLWRCDTIANPAPVVFSIKRGIKRGEKPNPTKVPKGIGVKLEIPCLGGSTSRYDGIWRGFIGDGGVDGVEKEGGSGLFIGKNCLKNNASWTRNLWRFFMFIFLFYIFQQFLNQGVGC